MAARLLRWWVRIPSGAWMSVCCGCCVLSGRSLCDELITRPEESYRLWCRVWSRKTNLVNEAKTHYGGYRAERGGGTESRPNTHSFTPTRGIFTHCQYGWVHTLPTVLAHHMNTSDHNTRLSPREEARETRGTFQAVPTSTYAVC